MRYLLLGLCALLSSCAQYSDLLAPDLTQDVPLVPINSQHTQNATPTLPMDEKKK